MPYFGAHLSIAGGYHNALHLAEEYNCEAVQLFTSAPKAWPVNPAGQATPLPAEAICTFHETRAQTGLRCLLAHNSYLINVASPDETVYRRSVEALAAELHRAEQLGLEYLVMHPGSHVGSGEEAGLARVAGALDEVQRRSPGYRVLVLLETTAGQGTNLGHRFEHLARIRELVAEPERVGVCLDTCHVFAAGYELAPAARYRATMKEFDRVIGLQWLRAFHLNDSLKPLGSRKDRHAHIGQGCLGIEPFRLLVTDRRFRDLPMVLETPKETVKKEDMDTVNLRTLRELRYRRKAD
jgi:deoxyribonuclease-4